MTIAETLAKIRARAEAKTVECGGDPIGVCVAPFMDCGGGCKGTGRTPDPSCAVLLNLVLVECECCQDICYCAEVTALKIRLGQDDDGGTVRCVPCYGTGHLARDWSGLPEGALAGSLKDAGEALGWIVTWGSYTDGADYQAYVWVGVRGDYTDGPPVAVVADTSDQAVAEAMLKALEER